MKRIKQTVIYFLVILILMVFVARSLDLNLTRQGAARSHAVAFRYGPAKKVLVDYERENGEGVVISSLGQYGLAVVDVIRYYNFFWTSTNSLTGVGILKEGEKAWANCDYRAGVFYGVADVPDGTKLIGSIGIFKNDWQILKVLEVTVEDGFFWSPIDEGIVEKSEEQSKPLLVQKIEDQSGQILFYPW